MGLGESVELPSWTRGTLAVGLGVRPTQALLHLPSPAFAPATHVTQGTAGGLCLACPAPCGPPHNTRTLGTPVLGWQVLRSSPETPACASSGRALLGLPLTAG